MRQRVVGLSMWFRAALWLAVWGWAFLAGATALRASGTDVCGSNAESRELDYWLGAWVVSFPGAPGSSTSKVDLELDKCVVVESWDGGKGHTGKNIFAYSADDKSWHGMFADNQGRVHIFEGKVAGGSAEFYGPSRGPKGEAVLNRIKIVRVAGDKVEQSWEKSTDNGTTWTTEFRGEYLRTKR
jgi:hypothetical protein